MLIQKLCLRELQHAMDASCSFFFFLFAELDIPCLIASRFELPVIVDVNLSL